MTIAHFQKNNLGIFGIDDLAAGASIASSGASFFSKLFGGGGKVKIPKTIYETMTGTLSAAYDGPVPDLNGLSFRSDEVPQPNTGIITQEGSHLVFSYNASVQAQGFQTKISGASQAVFTSPSTIEIQSSIGKQTGTLSGNVISWSHGIRYTLSATPSRAIVPSGGAQVVVPFSQLEASGSVSPAQSGSTLPAAAAPTNYMLALIGLALLAAKR